jgi:hypothetical protein
MLTFAVLLALTFVVWRVHVRREPSKALVAHREAALAVLAAERGLRFVEGTEPRAEGSVGGVFYTVFANNRAFEYDGGAALVARVAPLAARLAAWPRDPPDSMASFGDEIPTGDSTFDARFALLGAEPAAIRPLFDDSTRARLLSLGAPALVRDSGLLSLLLEDVPDTDHFDLALAIIAHIAGSSDTAYRG